VKGVKMAEIWRPKDSKIYQDWIKAIMDEATLNSWETDFIASISNRLDNGRTLTQAQEEVLDRIYTEKTN